MPPVGGDALADTEALVLVPKDQVQDFQEGQRFELIIPYAKNPLLFPVEDEDEFQVPEGVSLADATSGMMGLSSELIQEIAMDPALALWGEKV